MMRDTDLQFALIARQKGFIADDAFFEALELRASGQVRDLREFLRSGGMLHDAQWDDVEAELAAASRQTADETTRFDSGLGDSLGADSLLVDLNELEAGLDDSLPTLAGDGERQEGDAFPATDQGRYDFKAELGQGALGKVMLAIDRKFGREVAVKFSLGAAKSPSILRRFLREGQVAGRLAHPNVVPVYDLGTLETDDQTEPFFTMAKITGRDLSQILDGIREDEPDVRDTYTQARLLQIFLDVCHAMAYAHDHGVIHRDLKPANVMIGNYGETYVVDWGLAKVRGEPEEGGKLDVVETGAGATPELTLQGQVIGTPAYMPPEQAEGRIADIDNRSDVYSLGAILYEILTFHPPYEGATALEVLAKVVKGEIKRPTLLASQIREKAFERRKEGELTFLASIPPELEDVCLKALASSREERFQTAAELGREIQKFLDGEKTRARLAQLAAEKIAQGRRLAERLEKMREEHGRLRDAIKEETEDVKSFWPAEKKKPLWDRENKEQGLRRDIVKTFGKVAATFQEALGFEKGNQEARAELADLFWNQFLREEAARDEDQMLYFEGLVRQYNDGQYDAKLKGDGTVRISTKRFSCDCLRQGREVAPEEMDVAGFHPFSGRELATARPGLPALEEKLPTRWKVHRRDCPREALKGVSVFLMRLEEKDKIKLPVMPEGVGAGIVCDLSGDEAGMAAETFRTAIAAAYREDSLYAPKQGLYLGETPLEPFQIPMGSYVLVFHKPGFKSFRMPLFVTRQERIDLNVLCHAEADVPPGFAPVPAGAFQVRGDTDNPYSGYAEKRELPDFLLAAFPVTCAEYLAFLNDPDQRASGASRARVPREAATTGHYWPEDENGLFLIPTASWLEAAPEGLKEKARRLNQSPVDWEEDWPIMSISWEDAAAYAAWFAGKHGVMACLPIEDLWEKAARGVDGRLFTWGGAFEDTYLNCIRSQEGPNRPMPIDSYPTDESPYGLRGMNGNSLDWCLDLLDDGRRILRGGGWITYGITLRLTARMAGAQTRIGHANGLRLAIIVQLG